MTPCMLVKEVIAAAPVVAILVGNGNVFAMLEDQRKAIHVGPAGTTGGKIVRFRICSAALAIAVEPGGNGKLPDV